MNSKIHSFSRFIESFDSVRFGIECDDKFLRESHAKVELMLCLLFGDVLRISEPISFDSTGYLLNAYNILNNQNFNKLPEDHPLKRPFELALMPKHSSYNHMLQDRFSDIGFVLSAFPTISERQTERNHLVNSIVRKNYNEALKIIEQNDNAEQKLESLILLTNYFSKYGAGVTETPQFFLTDYIKSFLDINQSEIDKRFKNEAFTDELNKLQQYIHILNKYYINLNNRSDFRIRGKDILQEERVYNEITFRRLKEFMDSCYNFVIADALAAPMLNTSTGFIVRDLDKNLTTWNAKDFAQLSQDKLVYKKWSQPNYSRSQVTFGIHLQKEEVKFLQPISWDYLWQVVTDANWISSITKLRKSRALSDKINFDRDFEGHIDILDNLLKDYFKFSQKIDKDIRRFEITVSILSGVTEVIASYCHLHLPPLAREFLYDYTIQELELPVRGFYAGRNIKKVLSKCVRKQ